LAQQRSTGPTAQDGQILRSVVHDPRMDATLLVTPSVPTTRLIRKAIFELIEQRCEDKAGQKQLERLGFIDESGKEKSKVAGLGTAGMQVGQSVGAMG
jgi:hypothetical protein